MLRAGHVRYVALLAHDRAADEMRTDLADAIAGHAPGLKLRAAGERLALWTSDNPYSVPWHVSSDGKSCDVGWAFAPASAAQADRSEPEWWRLAWGGFVAFGTVSTTGEWHVRRSVDGLLPTRIVRLRGCTVVASDLPAGLMRALGIPPTIDWSAIAQILDDPSSASHRSAIQEVVSLPPGCCRVLPTGDERCFWTPGSIARGAGARVRADVEAGLRRAVDLSVAAWTMEARTVLVELSGGLDSAIVTGSLARLTPPPRIHLLNHATQEPGGDERSYARLVAERAGLPLNEIRIGANALDLSRLIPSEHPVEPLLYGLDLRHDEATAHAAGQVEADRILTGQGGDALFFQMPTLDVAADIVRLRGMRALCSPDLLDAARRARRSIWSAWRLVLRDRLKQDRAVEHFPAPFVTPEATRLARVSGLEHPWLRDLDDLPPAKITQIRAFVHSQIFHGPTARMACAPLIHPLLSQPVAEACLAAPVPYLAYGMIDRAAARAAFTDYVPAVVACRASKGEATGYYAGAVRNSLEFLRDLLLNGHLVSNGLLDRAGLDLALRTESLIAQDIYRPLLLYASIEAWAIHWMTAR